MKTKRSEFERVLILEAFYTEYRQDGGKAGRKEWYRTIGRSMFYAD
jgi:hypothetical protein